MSTSSFSFTAPYQNEEDVKVEFSKLTKEEQNKVLVDMYGAGGGRQQRATQNRRNELENNNDSNDDENNNDDDNDDDDNNDNDISEELLEKFHDEIDKIEDKEDYSNALLLAPNIVWETECNPKRFIRAEHYNPVKAASRLVKYWEMRCDIFEEDAFKPIILLDNGEESAMKDVIPFMVKIPNLFHLLPNDDYNRTVLCYDRTGMSFKDYDDIVLIKILWYVVHKALQEKRSIQKNGLVVVGINTSSIWEFPSRNFLKLLTESLSYYLPVRVCCAHGCFSSLVILAVVPIGQLFWSREVKLRIKVHNSIKKETLLRELETSFGLQRCNLPRSIGGNYNEKPTWFNECKRILKERQRQQQQTRALQHRRKRQRDEQLDLSTPAA